MKELSPIKQKLILIALVIRKGLILLLAFCVAAASLWSPRDIPPHEAGCTCRSARVFGTEISPVPGWWVLSILLELNWSLKCTQWEFPSNSDQQKKSIFFSFFFFSPCQLWQQLKLPFLSFCTPPHFVTSLWCLL